VRRVEIARLGRCDGCEAWARTGGGPPVAAVSTAWLSQHVHRLPRAVDQRLYLFAFATCYGAGQATSTKE